MMVEAGNLATIKIVNGVKVWDGKFDDVMYVGYPYIVSEQVTKMDESTDFKPEREIVPRLPDLGLKLKVLFWSPEHHCFACVRSDVYVN